MKMSDEDMAHYVKIIKLHESQRLSTNERQAYWEKYFTNRDTYFEGGEETSIDMDNF